MALDKSNLNTFHKLTSTIKTVKNWPLLTLDKFGLTSEVVYSFTLGYKLICRSRSTDINEAVVVASGIEYPPQYLKLKDDDVVIDLGANIGSFVVYVNQLNKSIYRGFAAEPFTENFDLLKRNLELNKITNWQADQVAISNQDGEVFIDTEKDFDAISVSSKGTKVKARKLSTYCQENKIKSISLLKMDIEGSEYDIFASDLDFVSKNVDRIILEYHYLSPEKNKQTLITALEKSFTWEDVNIAGKSGVMFFKNKYFSSK